MQILFAWLLSLAIIPLLDLCASHGGFLRRARDPGASATHKESKDQGGINETTASASLPEPLGLLQMALQGSPTKQKARRSSGARMQVVQESVSVPKIGAAQIAGEHVCITLQAHVLYMRKHPKKFEFVAVRGRMQPRPLSQWCWAIQPDRGEVAKHEDASFCPEQCSRGRVSARGIYHRWCPYSKK